MHMILLEREAIDKPSGDIYASELKELNELDAEEYQIISLKGIEHCIFLKKLYLEGNLISDLNPLTGLTSLKQLHLTDNQISVLTSLDGLRD